MIFLEYVINIIERSFMKTTRIKPLFFLLREQLRQLGVKVQDERTE